MYKKYPGIEGVEANKFVKTTPVNNSLEERELDLYFIAK